MNRCLTLMTLALSACATMNTSTDAGASPTPAPVFELAVRRLKPSQDVAAFGTARDAFVAKLKAQPGVSTDREFSAVFDFATMGAPTPPVFSGMTQYASMDAYQAAGAALGTAPEAGAFFATFDPLFFSVLRPLDPAKSVQLSDIAHAPGQLLEIATRDLSKYANFDKTKYEAARDAYLALLAAQPGVVAEYQWVSAIDPNLVVGMTVYESQAAFQAIAANPAVTSGPVPAAFFAYPPQAGFVHTVVR